MGREVRRVPANWQHPRSIYQRTHCLEEEYRPLYQGDFLQVYAEWATRLADWYRGAQLWQQGIYHDPADHISEEHRNPDRPREQAVAEWLEFISRPRHRWDPEPDARDLELFRRPAMVTYTDLAEGPPEPPNPEEYMPFGEWWQLFETVTEGTPVTPPFETAEELIRHLMTEGTFWDATPWTEHQARAMVSVGGASSLAMFGGGRSILNAREQMDLIAPNEGEYVEFQRAAESGR